MVVVTSLNMLLSVDTLSTFKNRPLEQVGLTEGQQSLVEKVNSMFVITSTGILRLFPLQLNSLKESGFVSQIPCFII
jgi:hypothetical protein